MEKLTQLGNGLNAFTFKFEEKLLDEIRESFFKNIKGFILADENKHLLQGGASFSQVIPEPNNNYYLTSYGKNPLLWISCNNQATYDIYERFYDALDIDQDVKKLIDYDEKIVMYCGFFVVGNRSPEPLWHVDYHPNANAYTLVTPLFEFDDDHNHLLYEKHYQTAAEYKYSVAEAVIFGDYFLHTTAPYDKSKRLRVLLSLTFGTDKTEYWPILNRTIGYQSKFIRLPCGHYLGSCNCEAFQPCVNERR